MNWSYFNKFGALNDKYLPDRGEGETKATQIVTAINKLVYKWYNDGDVFDNTYCLEGWANDLSSYANWLAKYVEGANNILATIASCYCEEDYEQLLVKLADSFMNDTFLEKLNNAPKIGTIYNCDGYYQFVENWDEEDDDEEY